MRTDITFILDRSGSMETIKADAEGGFNRFIKDQAAISGECKINLVQFDNLVETVFTGVPVAQVKPLVIVPRATTALLDAIGQTIVARGQAYEAMTDGQRPESVLIVIITDGHENASREYSHERVAEMIQHQTEKYAWQFVYLGASLDAVKTAKSMNITTGMVYTASGIGTSASYANLSSATARVRGGGSIAFTAEELAAQAAANAK